MPSLKDFLQEPNLFNDKEQFSTTIKSIEASHPENSDKASSVVIKTSGSGDKPCTIFFYLHPKMLWALAEALTALGVSEDDDVPELSDADAVAEFMQTYVGKTINVRAKQRTYEGKTRNEFTVKGIADGATLV